MIGRVVLAAVLATAALGKLFDLGVFGFLSTDSASPPRSEGGWAWRSGSLRARPCGARLLGMLLACLAVGCGTGTAAALAHQPPHAGAAAGAGGGDYLVIWKVTGQGGRVQTRHRDDGGDPKTRVTLDDTQTYKGRVEFTLILRGDGDFSHTGTGTYSEATWHLQGTNGDHGSFSCDPTVSTNSPFDVKVSGYSSQGAASLHMTLSAQESNQDTDCGADFTAYGGTSSYLADSLAAVGANHMRLIGKHPSVPIFRKHTHTVSGTTTTDILDEWTFTISCVSDHCPPSPAEVQQQHKDDAAKAVADYMERIRVDKAVLGALGCRHSHNRELDLSCFVWAARLVYDDAALRSAQQLAADPPDSHYRAIAKPRPLRISLLSGNHRIAAANSLIYNWAQAGGLLRALVTTLNRAGSAAFGGSGTWTRRQNAAAKSYAHQLVKLVREQRALASRVRRQLVAARLAPRKAVAGLANRSALRSNAALIRVLTNIRP